MRLLIPRPRGRSKKIAITEIARMDKSMLAKADPNAKFRLP